MPKIDCPAAYDDQAKIPAEATNIRPSVVPSARLAGSEASLRLQAINERPVATYNAPDGWKWQVMPPSSIVGQTLAQRDELALWYKRAHFDSPSICLH